MKHINYMENEVKFLIIELENIVEYGTPKFN
jgi:hypothetical protein